MIELVSISNIYGDCTSDYEIIHSPLDTVGDIIDHATENDEWGNFVINGERFYSGKYVIMNVPEEIRSKHIRNANCSGGWGTIIQKLIKGIKWVKEFFILVISVALLQIQISKQEYWNIILGIGHLINRNIYVINVSRKFH